MPSHATASPANPQAPSPGTEPSLAELEQRPERVHPLLLFIPEAAPPKPRSSSDDDEPPQGSIAHASSIAAPRVRLRVRIERLLFHLRGSTAHLFMLAWRAARFAGSTVLAFLLFIVLFALRLSGFVLRQGRTAIRYAAGHLVRAAAVLRRPIVRAVRQTRTPFQGSAGTLVRALAPVTLGLAVLIAVVWSASVFSPSGFAPPDGAGTENASDQIPPPRIAQGEDDGYTGASPRTADDRLPQTRSGAPLQASTTGTVHPRHESGAAVLEPVAAAAIPAGHSRRNDTAAPTRAAMRETARTRSGSAAEPHPARQPAPAETIAENAAQAQPQRTEAVTPKVPSTAATRTRYRGVLAIDSAPAGAMVFINREPVGATPLVLKDMPIGSHAVRIEAEGYQAWSAAVRVAASQRTHVSAQLRERTE